MYLLISSNLVDNLDMKKTEYKIADSDKTILTGQLTLNTDGSYSATVSLADLNAGDGKIELKLEDHNKVKYIIKEKITIS